MLSVLVLSFFFYFSSADPSFGYFLQISDIHFNPYTDPSLMPQLLKADVSQWETLFSKSGVNGYGTPGKDETNANLLIAGLQRMGQADRKPDFVIFTGDFIAHNFDTQFGPYVKNGVCYSTFVKKNIAFVVAMFNKYLPGTRVYFCLGNNDCDTGDYEIVPDGQFLHDTAPLLSANFIKDPEDQQAFATTYPKGGYYMVTPPGTRNFFIISLNSNFFSEKYVNSGSTDPAAQELDWLDAQLKRVRQQNGKAWILLHIPPGADVYKSIKNSQYTAMWKKEYNDRFIQILKANGDIITAGFSGHTHMDEFRILTQSLPSRQAVSFLHTCPALSPQFGNNPAFEQFSYDRGTLSTTNYEVYYLNLLQPPTPGSALFQPEYNFTTAYGQPTLTAATMLTTYDALNTNTAFQNLYMKYYNVGNTASPGMDTSTFKTYWCGNGNLTQTDFSRCSGIQ